jgi:alkylated DNA nucleotide flippase Atl1
VRAEQKTIGKLLQGQTQFIVPVFQRGYVWTQRNVRRLWADLLAVSLDDVSRHFLGAFVLAPTPVASGFEKRFVVDGQQRLTTLSILFCALRDHVRPRDPALGKKIDELYLLNPHEEGEDRLKLVPVAPADRAEWFAIVKGAPTAGGDNNIGLAYRVFRQELASVDDDDPIDILRIERAIAYQCDVVEVEVQAQDNVHRIFESLNHGGEPLLQADLLRNYVFMRLPTSWRTVHDQHWEPMQRLLSPSDLEDLVRINLVLRGHTRVDKETVYQTQQVLMKGLGDEQAVQDWAAELHRQAQLYKRILTPAEEPDPVVRAALARLSSWYSKAGNPLALAVLSHFDDKRLEAKQTAQALRVVESYLVRRSLVGFPTNSDSRNLAAVAKDFATELPTPEAITKLLSAGPRGFPADDQVREAISETNFYDNSSKEGYASRRFILRCLEASYDHREQVDVDTSRVTIEHILPRRMSGEWKVMLDGDTDGDETVEDVHGALVHKLGNLTLTAYNNELGNQPWASKRRVLADSGLAMNRELASQKRWGKRQILARSAALADRIVEIWPGPTPAGGAVAVTPPAPAQRGKQTPADRKWRRLPQILAVIPAGRWTSFADVAQVVGDHPAAVGHKINEGAGLDNAHRVLKLRQPVPTAANRPRLEAEGVRFDRHGKAAPEQRFTGDDLREAIGVEATT